MSDKTVELSRADSVCDYQEFPMGRVYSQSALVTGLFRCQGRLKGEFEAGEPVSTSPQAAPCKAFLALGPCAAAGTPDAEPESVLL